MAMLFDCHPLSWTSGEDLHLAVCRALIERGVQPVIISAGISPLRRKKYETGGVIVEEVNYSHGVFRYFWRMRAIFRRYRVDTVDIEFFSYFQPIAWMARLSGVKNIIFTESNSGVMRAKSWKLALLRLRAAIATLPVKRFVASSEFVRSQMLHLGLNDGRISVVHKGVDLQRYTPDPSARDRLVKQHGGDPNEIVLGTVAVIRPFKQPETILKACGLLQKHGVRFRLFAAGGGALMPELQELAARLGIVERVHWLGYVDSPEELFRGLDVFLLASEGEAFGFVLLEAMSCGVAVVATASGAIPEIIEKDRSGLLTPVKDSAAMADAIRALSQDPERRCKIAQEGYVRARNRFALNFAVEKTIRVYESLWRSGHTATMA